MKVSVAPVAHVYQIGLLLSPVDHTATKLMIGRLVVVSIDNIVERSSCSHVASRLNPGVVCIAKKAVNVVIETAQRRTAFICHMRVERSC